MDERGNDPTNPNCNCGVSSKRQVSGEAKGRVLHYVCRLGRCNYYMEHRLAEGEQLGLNENLVAPLGLLYLI